MIGLLHKVWSNKLSNIILFQWLSLREPFSSVLIYFTLLWKKHRVRIRFNNPSPEMEKSTKFFNEPSVNKRIQKNVESFFDSESKETYLGIIKFRQTMDTRYLKYHGYKNQYFNVNFIKHYKEYQELFIDCGAFIGDSVINFIKHCPPSSLDRCNQIVCFEPDATNYMRLKRFTKKIPCVRYINAGVFDKTCEMKFDMQSNSVTKLNNCGCEMVKLYRLDDLQDELQKVTFIKMDIEGAELAALKGAVNLIKRDLPKLAICIYHSNEDMVDIPEFVRDNFPQYRLFVRHHNVNSAETVLYGIAD